MKEHYVSYEQAVKLKDLGFDWGCNRYYNESDNPSERLLGGSSLYLYSYNTHFGKDGGVCSAPRLDQAQAWLREVKGIHISLNPYSISPDRYDGDNYFWSFELFHVPTGGWLKVNGGGFDTYESALSAGIDKALELLTNKLNRE